MKKTKLLFLPFLAITFLTGCGAPDPGPSYNITYLNLGDSTTDNPASYKTVDAFTLKAPTDHGYKFLGWHIDNAEGELITEIKKGRKGDLKLYATWGEPNTYSINYTNLNGSTTTIPTSYTISDSFTLSNPTDHGYEFSCWRFNDAGGIPAIEIKTGTFGNLTLYASWGKGNTYSITYKNVDGVEFENPKEYNFNNEVKLNNPTTFKKGYNAFGGWYFDEALTEPANNGWASGSHYGNLTLYAKWVNPIKYNITYLNVQDSEHTNPKTYTIEDEIILTGASRAGYTFVNWLKNGKTGEEIDKITKGTTGDLTIYCNLSANTYSITYHNLGLAITDNPTNFVYDTGVNKLNVPTTESGYEFLGWRLGSQEGESITKIEPYKYVGNLDIYATWGKKKTYTIEYDLWGGVTEGSNPSTYTVEDDFILKSPKQEGFIFTGWYLDKYKDKLFNKYGVPKNTVGNLKLYAGWKSTTILERFSWKRINEIANVEKTASKYFDIGDTKIVSVGEHNIKQPVRIIAFHHDILANSVDNEESYAEITFEFEKLLTVGETDKHKLYTVHWGIPSCLNYAESYIHSRANEIYNNELRDSELKNNIKLVKKLAGYNMGDIRTFDVKLFPLAASEVDNSASFPNEGKLYTFYRSSPSLLKVFDNRFYPYWLRTESMNVSSDAYAVSSAGKINPTAKNDIDYDRGISPAFCI